MRLNTLRMKESIPSYEEEAQATSIGGRASSWQWCQQARDFVPSMCPLSADYRPLAAGVDLRYRRAMMKTNRVVSCCVGVALEGAVGICGREKKRGEEGEDT